MKEFFTKLAMSALFYLVMGSMVFGIYTDQHQFVDVAAAAFWILILLGATVGWMILLCFLSLDSLTDEASRAKVIESAGRYSKKSNVIFRLWGWIRFIAAVAMLAYSGWIFTAVCYALTYLFVRLGTSLMRDKLETLRKTAGEDWREVRDQRQREMANSLRIRIGDG